MLVHDLFFTSRITPALESLGRRAVILSRGDLLEELCREERPALVLVDIGAPSVDWAAAVRRLRSNADLAEVPIVAFGPHKDLEARDRALAAGCTEVLANSKLLSDLTRIVSRYLEPT